MNNRALRVLEYDKIMKMLSERTVSALGRSYIESLKPVSDYYEVQDRLKETSDAAAYLWRKGGAPFGGIHDIRGSLRRVEIGSTLSISELLKTGDVLRCGRVIKQFLTNDVPADWEGNTALELGRQITVFKHVEDALKRNNKEEEISDCASPELTHKKVSAEAGRYKDKKQLLSVPIQKDNAGCCYHKATVMSSVKQEFARSGLV